MKELLTSIEDNRRTLLSFRTVKEAHTTYTIRTFRANETRALKKKATTPCLRKILSKSSFCFTVRFINENFYTGNN